MYNYSLKLTYRTSNDDDVYRDELMQAFDIQTYDSEVINNIINKELNPLLKDQFLIVYQTMNKHNQFPFTLEDSVCVTLLLSWEYFNLFHLCLGEIKENKITNSITNLISELIKTK